MRIGIVKEIKNKENRVALPPAGVGRLIQRGHQVLVQKTAGIGSGFSDQDYLDVGAEISNVAATWAADMVVKVKEPLKSEYGYLRQQILFTFLHLAGVARGLTEALVDNKTTAVAYETIEDEVGNLPLLAPMSAVAGNMATLVGSYYLASFNAGKGVQLGTVLGRKHGNVVIIGDGVVGKHAGSVAAGMGANVLIFGQRPERAALLKQEISNDIDYIISEPERVAEKLQKADLVVGAVLSHGARAPHLVTREMVKHMEPRSVIVDVSIDQGGCFETSRPTSHSDPIYVEHGVTHYCVTNMPGAFPKTSTIALSDATLPYVLKLADQGIEALLSDPGFAKGLNTYQGFITCKPVAEAFDMLPVFRQHSELV